MSENHLYNDNIDAMSLGTNSICSFYSYGQISSDEDFDYEDDFDDSDNDSDY